MSTFEIKMTVLSMLGESATADKANELYNWVMEEVEIEETDKKANVTQLTTVN